MTYTRISWIVFIIIALKVALIGVYDFGMPSEARYAAISMRMVLTDNYLMPYFSHDIPFLGKPPLAFWASALSMEVFGLNEFAARLPQLLAVFATCAMIYHFVIKSYDNKTAVVSLITFFACAISYALASVMTEAFLLLGMTITTLSFWLQIQSKKAKNIFGYLFFFGCVISALTKGLAGICFPALSIFLYLLFSKRWKDFFTRFPLFIGSILFFALSAPWFFMAEAKYPGFAEYFFIGENFYRFVDFRWAGDKYGHAHGTYFGAIWAFFIVLTMPVMLVLLVSPRQNLSSWLNNLYRDKTLAFFTVCFFSAMAVLTFMRNMIGTYVIYALVPFVIIISRIIIIRNWERFALFLAYLTLIGHCVFLVVFLIDPALLTKSSKYDIKLVKQIEGYPSIQDGQVYYVGQSKETFLLSWYTKDKIRSIEESDISRITRESNLQKYFIAGIWIDGKYALKQISCFEENLHCLYESIK
jgi:4-amino-4-deoxy-L-arabinose transferase-like glycosyltransferase